MESTENAENDSPQAEPETAAPEPQQEPAPAPAQAEAPAVAEPEAITPPSPSAAVSDAANPAKSLADAEAAVEDTNRKVKKAKDSERRKLLSNVKSNATSFPMVELVAEQVRTTVPKKITDRVKAAKKKEIISSTYPYKQLMDSDEYEEEIALLQIELVKMQSWAKETGERIVAIFEGRDAAGKGGTIKRFTENLNPRGARVVALTKPSEAERGQWYFQRYIENLPTKGEIVFFDRSWYNRAGVEHVMGFCSGHEYLEFMRQAPEYERMLVRSGIKLFKFWFSVSREEQLRRFLSRAKDPLKQWKLSPMDVESLARWDEYTKAKEAMLFYTDTADAPWTVVRSDDKKRARLNAIKFLLSHIPYSGKDLKSLPPADHKIVGSAKDIYEIEEKKH